MFKKIYLFALLFLISIGTYAFETEYHVSVNGNDNNQGTQIHPFRTIQAAADVARPGDAVIVHAGTYREWIDPRFGGTGNNQRITYMAAPGEKVYIKGSEVLTGWKKGKDKVWSKEIDDHHIKEALNIYVEGDWFSRHGRDHHTSDIYLNGISLFEVENMEKVIHPVRSESAIYPEQSLRTWYAEQDGERTILYANFGDADPNQELVEISVRPTCFYPTDQYIDYLTIQGFDFSQAATQWGAPTAHQVGMIATHWNKGWIIENNTVHDTKCSGITLGKERSSGHNVWMNHPEKDGALHYIEVTFNAIRNNWDKDHVGSHIVRNNIIYNCEQTGICGSMGCAFSYIHDNHIYDINVKRQFTGAETGGIKFHAAIDTRIEHNRIHQAQRGIWLDWMTQGTRVTRNLLYSNISEDLFVEVSHGPYIVDNNIMLSSRAILNQSQGGAFVHNLITGSIYMRFPSSRYTPYQLPHSTDVKGLSIIVKGDDRFFNNLFIPVEKQEKALYGLNIYNDGTVKLTTSGNTFYNHACAYKAEHRYCRMMEKFKAGFKLTEENGSVYLELTGIDTDDFARTQMVTSQQLGKTLVSEACYENPDGSAFKFDYDYFGQPRKGRITCGPFQNLEEMKLKVY